MATYTVITYHCPKCRVQVSGNQGFLTAPVITCKRCGHEFVVNREFFINSWRNQLFLLSWLFLLVAGVIFTVMVPSDLSAQLWRAYNTGETAGEQAGHLIGYLLGMVIGVGILAAIVAAPVGICVGGILGAINADKVGLDY